MHESQAALAHAPANIAVHVGISWTEYARLAAYHGAGAGLYSAQGAVLSVAPGRVSYHFGLTGPAVSYGALQSVSAAKPR